MALCTECDGKGGWWVNSQGQRRASLMEPDACAWHVCTEPGCFAGHQSCCHGETAANDPEDYDPVPPRRQTTIEATVIRGAPLPLPYDEEETSNE